MKNRLSIFSEPKYSQMRSKNICVVRMCGKGAGNKGKFRFCYKHHRQHQKFNNPLRYWFDMLRQNARMRKIPFELTIKEFQIFCEKTRYLELKGKHGNNYSIDRINAQEGYFLANLQLLTLSQNTRKKYIDLKIRFGYYPTDDELKEFFKGEPHYIESEILEVQVQDEQQDEQQDECPF